MTWFSKGNKRIHDALLGLRRRFMGAVRTKRLTLEQNRLREIEHSVAPLLASTLSGWYRGSPIDDSLVADIEKQRIAWLDDWRDLSVGHDDPDLKMPVSVACRASKPRIWAELLYRLVETHGSTSILELGTNLGISSAYLASAARKHGGGVVTMEGSRGRQELARKFHESLGLENVDYVLGRFDKTLKDVLVDRAFDLAFIDGHHQLKPTLRYHEQIVPSVEDGGIVIYDDINWSRGMIRAWRQIRQDPRFVFVLDLVSIGIAVVGRDREKTQPEILRFPGPGRLGFPL